MIAERIKARCWLTLNGFLRHAMVRGISGFGPPKVVLTAYPKSGGTWIAQMLAEYLSIPHPRYCLPPRRRCLLHGHYPSVAASNDTIVVWRDGRDVMVSFYYHLLFEREGAKNLPGQARAYRQKLGIADASDIHRYLPRFIADSFTNGLPRGSWVRLGSMSWTSFANAWQGRTDYLETRYEAMIENPHRELSKLLRSLSVSACRATPRQMAGRGEIDRAKLDGCIAKFSFENLAGRQPGDEDIRNIIRKGIIGDWKNKFTREAREIFDYYAGKTLIDLGYEADRAWVDV